MNSHCQLMQHQVPGSAWHTRGKYLPMLLTSCQPQSASTLHRRAHDYICTLTSSTHVSRCTCSKRSPCRIVLRFTSECNMDTCTLPVWSSAHLSMTAQPQPCLCTRSPCLHTGLLPCQQNPLFTDKQQENFARVTSPLAPPQSPQLHATRSIVFRRCCLALSPSLR